MRKKLLCFSFVLVALLSHGYSYATGMKPAEKEYRKANKLFASAKYKEAIPLYQQVLNAPPDDVALSEVHTKIGDSYFRLGLFEKALDEYRNALREQRRPERPVTQYWIGFCCFLLGRNEEAIREFLKIPEFYPGSGMWVSTAYYWAGRASERLRKMDKAAEYYRKAGGDGLSTQGRFAAKRAAAMKK